MPCNTCDNGDFKLIEKPHYKRHSVQQVKRWCEELKCFVDWQPENCQGYEGRKEAVDVLFRN
jgi:hypothetical protein